MRQTSEAFVLFDMNFKRAPVSISTIIVIVQYTQIACRANLTFLVVLSPFPSFFSLSECFVEDVSALEALIERFNTLDGRYKNKYSSRLYTVVLK